MRHRKKEVITVSRTYNRSLNEVLEASISALKNCGFTITEKGQRVIEASSGISLRSWGEHIQINLSSTSEGTEAKVTSEAKAQLFDLGKSEENVSRFFSELEKQLGLK